MTHNDQLSLFLAILSAHKGLSRAISVAHVAGRLGFEPGKNGERRVQHLKQEAVGRGVLIGSSCGKVSGYYTPETEQEIRATLANYKSRIRSLAQLIRNTEGAAGLQSFMGQLAMEFAD